jgi:hypothetical protein
VPDHTCGTTELLPARVLPPVLPRARAQWRTPPRPTHTTTRLCCPAPLLPRLRVPVHSPFSVREPNALIYESQIIGFEHARTWLADVRMHADPHLTCILVGNKSDLSLERRQVPTDEGERWAKEEGLLFVEASAKSGDNVDVAFGVAARDILSKIRRGVFDDDRVRRPLAFLFPLTALIHR